MRTLLDSLNNLAYPAVPDIAQGLGEADTAVSRALPATFASMLEALVLKSRSPGFPQIYDLIGTRPPTSDLARDARNILGTITAGTLPTGNGERFLTMIFGGRVSAVGDLIARTVGFKNTTSGQTLLALTSPLMMAVLGKIIRDDGFNAPDLANLLARERDGIQAALPPGLTSLLNGSAAASYAEADRFQAARPSRRKHDTPAVMRQTSLLWLWPVLAVAVFALVVFASRRHRNGEAITDSAALRAGTTVESSAGEVSSATTTGGALGAFVTHELPNGVSLRIPQYGIESKLIAFVEETSRPVDETTWFEFDRLNFATGSATLLPGAEEQLTNIADILRAYPHVDVKIGAYTDNVGNMDANRRLSRQRATAVRQALIDDGIPTDRITAEGYGEQHPVADNSTEEGRARNRRIALRVTQK